MRPFLRFAEVKVALAMKVRLSQAFDMNVDRSCFPIKILNVGGSQNPGLSLYSLCLLKRGPAVPYNFFMRFLLTFYVPGA
jgi:hypothetical protein